jgi:hypothetical protein
LDEAMRLWKCTFDNQGPILFRQMLYHCKTCGLVGDFMCCESCAIACHNGHALEAVGIISGCCLILSNAQNATHESKANPNFSISQFLTLGEIISENTVVSYSSSYLMFALHVSCFRVIEDQLSE